MKIPILKITFGESDITFINENITNVLKSGCLTMGPYTEKFEEEFCIFSKTAHAIATSSATSALEIIIRALEIHDRVIIVPTNTFFATALAVMHSDNRVAFVDSNPETMCMDVRSLERHVRLSEEKPAAVIYVHIGGVISTDIYAIKKICDDNHIPLIEDCAHAHGCSIEGRMAGTIGIAGAFSFFPTKVFVTGEGGIITTNDRNIAEKARSLRNHGKSGNGEIVIPGNNWRLSEIAAVIGCQQMSRAVEICYERNAIAKKYDELLTGFAGVHYLEMPKEVYSSYYKYIAFIDDKIRRDDLKNKMKEMGVALAGEVYARMCHEEPVWKTHDVSGRPKVGGVDWTSDNMKFSGAEVIRNHHICLPLYPSLTDEEIIYVVRVLKECIHAIA